MGVKKLGEELDDEDIIAKINRVCEKVDTSVDPTLRNYQSKILRKEEQ